MAMNLLQRLIRKIFKNNPMWVAGYQAGKADVLDKIKQNQVYGKVGCECVSGYCRQKAEFDAQC
jgi:hypothetical protein